MKRHYHVVQKLIGCYMPDSSDMYGTKVEARWAMSDAVRQAKDAQSQANDYKLNKRSWQNLGHDEYPWTGSLEGGYSNGVDEISIEQCYDDCEQED